MSTIRSAALRGFRATVAELGGSAEEYAAQAGIPMVALDSDDVLVSDLAVARVLETTAHELDCPDLGLRIASRQDLGMLGPLALAIRNAPTLADALGCASRYLFLHARGLTISMESDPDGARGVVAVRYGSSATHPIPIQGTDLSLGFIHRATKLLVGDDRYGLRSVDLPYRPPAPIEVYEHFFGAPVRVGKPSALLRIPRSFVNRPLNGSDEGLMQLALTFLAEQAPGAAGDVTEQVRAALQRSLGTTAPEIAVIARLLVVHPRTLQRRLAAEGTSFAIILDDVRRGEALRYLTTTSMPMSQVAALIGLSEQSTLTRCSRRWWNSTPLDVRRGSGASP